MCGIFGFAGLGTKNDLVIMGDMLAHRGPDGFGYYADDENRLYLGHRRLSIIDIEGGAQPMSNLEGTVTIVFNGEIYNHKDLRADLESKGYRFLTDHSDTEVLIHGYTEWGIGLLTRLNGMFAFAIYDKIKGTIFLARDRFGEKPLFWSMTSQGFGFSSELTALSSQPYFKSHLDRNAIKKYFGYGFIPAPQTIFKNIQKLPGGGWLKYDISNKTIKIAQFWDFHITPDNSLNNEDQLAEELKELVIKSVKRRLMADVPLGLFLSGGIDSTIVAYCMRKLQPCAEVHSFTIGFNEPSFDEAAYAENVANFYQLCHKTKKMNINDMRELMPHIMARLDEPLADPSIIPTYMVSEFASHHAKVVLTGDGGDELFAGYDPFVALKYAKIYQSIIPSGLHSVIYKLAESMPLSDKYMSLDFKVRRGLAGMKGGPDLWNPLWMASANREEISELFYERTTDEEIFEDAIALWHRDSSLNIEDKTLEFFTKFYLQNDILVKTDRATMMNGIEGRAIFLDPELVDFSAKLPSKYKIRNGDRKYLLKKAFAKDLPKNIVARKKKGFGIPINSWLRDTAIETESARLLEMNADFIKKADLSHKTKSEDHRLLLWSWYTFDRFTSKMVISNQSTDKNRNQTKASDGR